ncbi:MAG: translation elongation factor Ts [Pseudomonadota bacterium]|nr:translation elongation factor Ts [Pseudomonadota bacterium]
MVEITAGLVKELREKSGAGMMDCKMALTENDGNIDLSIDWLRAKGITKAAKKSDRIASEGLIGSLIKNGSAAMIELNSETDFVARNDEFQDLLRGILEVSIDNDEVESVQYQDTGRTVAEEINEKIATIGENIMLRRVTKYENIEDEHIFSYTHNAVAESLGKIGVLVAIKSKSSIDNLADFGKNICMHIAATNPLALASNEISPELIEREKQIALEQARESGKPENIIEKMVEGRIKKFTEENALLSQVFVIDGETKIEKLLENKSSDLNEDVIITRFTRMQLGDGIEKKEDDFAGEVAAAINKN